MAKRTDQELDDDIKALFGFKAWSPLLAQDILARDEAYDPPDDADMTGSASRLITAGDISLVSSGPTDMQHLYVTTDPLPTDPE